MPKRKKGANQRAPRQIDEFRKAARELGCGDTAGEDEIMRRLAGQKRREAPKKKPGRKSRAR